MNINIYKAKNIIKRKILAHNDYTLNDYYELTNPFSNSIDRTKLEIYLESKSLANLVIDLDWLNMKQELSLQQK